MAPGTESGVTELRAGIRVRITATATVVVVAVLLVTAVALVVSQRRALTEDVDDSLRLRSRELVSAHDAGALAETISGQGDEDAVAQVVDSSGVVIASSANFAGEPPLPGPPTGQEASLRDTHLAADDARYRLLSRRSGGLTVHTGTPLDDVDESVATLRRNMTVTIPAVAAALAALVWLLVGRTLRPVEAMRAEVADITGASLHRRVPEPANRDEIARLARTMNAMLDRLEETAERQRLFIADASHELRSPLARMFAELEVDVAHPETADVAATHRSTLEEVRGLQRLVDDLLLLARADSGGAADRRDAVDLAGIALREAGALPVGDRIEVDTSGVAPAEVSGDPAQLTRAVRNILENAARHAATRVVVAVAERDGRAELSVCDDGPGIPASEHERVFERFARLDFARSAADGGSGLGLAITREIIERHGGSVTVDPVHSPGRASSSRSPRTRGDSGRLTECCSGESSLETPMPSMLCTSTTTRGSGSRSQPPTTSPRPTPPGARPSRRGC